MDKLQFQAHWNQIKGKLKEKFGKLTDDDLITISGKKDQLVGKLQALYGLNREKVEEQLRLIENGYYNEELRNHWNELQAKLKQKWNALTEDDIQRIKGRADQLLTQLQERYHLSREKAEAEFHSFIESLGVSQDSGRESGKERGKDRGKERGKEKVGSHGDRDHRR